MKRFIALFTCIALIAISCLSLSAFGADTKTGFGDIPDDFWAKDAIGYLTNSGVVNGYEDGTFKPDNNVTREEFAKLLDVAFEIRAWQPSSFTDVDQSRWSASYIADSGSSRNTAKSKKVE